MQTSCGFPFAKSDAVIGQHINCEQKEQQHSLQQLDCG
jgi:hypothetical protein